MTNTLSLKEQMELIEKNEFSIASINNPYEEVCLEVVKKDGKLLHLIPNKNRTYNVCLEAVKEYGYSIQYVPKDIITEEMCLEAIKNDEYVIDYIPQDKITYRVCLESVRKNGLSLEKIPLKYINEELCLEAIKKTNFAIRYVPKEKQTPNICLEAVKKNGYNIRYISDKTPSVCMYAFLNYYQLLNKKYVKKGIEQFMKQELSLTKTVFCENIFIHNIVKNQFNINEDEYDLMVIDKMSLDYLKDFLIKNNNKNTFVLSDTYTLLNIDVLKNLALSDNELIIVDTGNTKNIHKVLANKIVPFIK